MGWGPPTCLSHLLRDNLQLRLTCQCGHVATPDIKDLRAAMQRRAGCEQLAELPLRLRCGECAGKGVRYELIPLRSPDDERMEQ
jgi:hypothetical protein